MKKLFTLLAVTAIGSVAFGQRLTDVSIQTIVEPSEFQSNAQNNTPVPINFAVYNDGPDDIMVGDSVYFAIIVTNMGNSIQFQIPNGANTGIVTFGSIMTRNVIPGDTFHFVANYNALLYAPTTFQVKVIGRVFMRNLPDLNFEGTGSSTNNTKESQIIWYNKDRFPLSNAVVIAEDITTYPNPAGESTTISVSTLQTDAATTVRILDLKGQEVYSRTMEAGTFDTHDVNTSAFENGIYVVQVSSGDQIRTGKLVVNH